LKEKNMISKKLFCTCGGEIRNLTKEEAEIFNVIPAHNRGKCIACGNNCIIHRSFNGEAILARSM